MGIRFINNYYVSYNKDYLLKHGLICTENITVHIIEDWQFFPAWDSSGDIWSWRKFLKARKTACKRAQDYSVSENVQYLEDRF